MTQQIINTGAANDGTGESLRNAFIAVNDNFTQIWAAGPVDSQVTITNNVISTNVTNLPLILAGNGTATITLDSTTIPGIDSVYDLGSPTKRFDSTYSQYFYGNGRFLTGISGESGGGNVTFSETSPTSPSVGDVWIQSNTAVQFIYFNDSTSNQWAEMEAFQSFGSSSSGNGSNVNFQSVASDIIPSVNNGYSLGNAAQQWNNAWLGNTLYIKTIPLTVSNTALTFNGESVLTTGSNLRFANLSVTGNITTNAIYTNNYFYANGAPFAPGANVIPNSSIRITGNTISTATLNQNLTLAANGIGSVQTNSTIIPGIDAVYDIGSPTLRMDTVYATYFVGNGAGLTGITSSGSLSGNLAGNLQGNGFGANAFSFVSATGNITGNYFIGNGSLLTGLAATYGNANVVANLAALGSNPISTTGNITSGYFIGNGSQLTGIATSANVNFNAVASNIIPTGNSVYSLGNATNQWNDLYLSNATIYMNSVPISLTAGNVLTVNGADVVTSAANGESNIGNLTILGTTISIAAGVPNTYLNLSANVEGWAYVQVPNDATANVSNVRIHNDAGNIEFGTGDYSTGATGYIWTLSNEGTTTIPGLISSSNTIEINNRATSNTADIRLNSADDIFLQGRDKPDDLEAEGGDIFVYGGDGANAATNGFDTGGGGDVQIEGGQGGNADGGGSSGGGGGIITIRGGDGGTSLDSNAGGGGDINLTAGSAPGAATTALGGLGGGVNIIAGTTTRINESGGSIELSTGGASGDGTGAAGYVSINIPSSNVGTGGQWIFGGTGTTLNVPANAEIYGANAGNLTVGCAGNTIVTSSDYGANVQNWVFGYTGNLILPQGGVVYETNIPSGGLSGKTIALTPYGGTNADQQLLVYPTAGADANHLHLTTGNLWNTELFLGNDDLYVKLANTGNIVINANDNTGNTAQWTFGTEGTILNSGNLTLQTPSGIPTSLANWQGGGGWNQGSYTDLATTGGTGTGLTVDVAAGGGGYISINEITIHTPGTGYTTGDVITIDNENNIPGTFTISVSSSGWTLDTTGNLTVAGSIIMPPNSALVGSGASPAPSINGFGTISSANVFTGFISLDSGRINGGNATVVTDGINSIASAPGAQMDVYGFPFSGGGVRGQLTISGVTTPSQANGTWYYQSINTYTYQIYTNSTYSTLVDATGWSAYTGSGSVAITRQDPAANIVINSNGYFSTFDNTGNLTLPGNLSVVGGTISLTGEGVLRSIDDTVALLSLNTSTGNANSVYLGTSGGLGFNDQEIGGNWLEIFRNGTEPEIRVPVGLGNLNIQTAEGANAYNWTFDNTGNLTLPGNISGNTNGYTIGYRDIPQVSFTGNATIATTDAGKHFYSTLSTGNVLTIANNASQGFQIGTAISIVNQGTGNITVAQGSGVTLYMAGNATSGNRSIATFGMATIMKVATNTWFINGTGVS